MLVGYKRQQQQQLARIPTIQLSQSVVARAPFREGVRRCHPRNQPQHFPGSPSLNSCLEIVDAFVTSSFPRLLSPIIPIFFPCFPWGEGWSVVLSSVKKEWWRNNSWRNLKEKKVFDSGEAGGKNATTNVEFFQHRWRDFAGWHKQVCMDTRVWCKTVQH